MNRHPHPLLAVILLLWASFPSTLAASAEAISLQHLSLEMRAWSPDEGLPSTQLASIAQTSDGFIWVSGRGFLARFNGRRFDRFRPAHSLGPDMGFITHLVADREGPLWLRFATRARLAVYRNNRFSEISLPTSTEDILDFCAAPQGGIVACIRLKEDTSEGTIRILRISPDGSLTFGPSLKSPQLKSLSLSATNDGKVWAIGNQRVLFDLQPDGLHSIDTNGHPVNVFANNPDGTLGAVGPEAFLSYDQERGRWEVSRTFTTPIPGIISTACLNGSGHLFLSVKEKLWTVSANGKVNRLERGRDRLITASTMMSAHDGSVWFRSRTHLSQLRYSPFVTWPLPEHLSSPRVHSLATELSGCLWAACRDAVCVLNPQDTSFKVVRTGNQLDRTQLAPHPDGGMWLCPPSGEIELVKDEFPRKFKIPSSARRRQFVVDGNGVAWLATEEGLFTCNPQVDNSFRKIAFPDPSNIKYLAVDSANRLYVQTFGAGTFIHASHSQAGWRRAWPFHEPIRQFGSMFSDPANRIWGLSSGRNRVFCADQTKIISSSATHLGLGDSAHGAMAFDAFGGAWIALHHNGVFHFEMENLLEALRDPSAPPAGTHFSRSAGLGSIQGPYHPGGIAKDNDGYIWVATAKGASSINPKRWHEERARSTPPQVYIESFLADDTPVPLPSENTQKIDPPVETEEIRIRFHALDFGKPGETTYRYRLLELNDQWTEADAETFAIFQRLAPGTYQFEVKAADRFGNWSKRPATLSFSISPQWWQRTWVRVAAVTFLLLLAGLIYWGTVGIMRRRQRAQVEFSQRLLVMQEEERKRVAQEVHDGLGQHLLLIKNFAELTSAKIAPDSPAAEDLGEMTEIAEEAIAETRSITENLRPAEIDRLGLPVAVQSMVDKVSERSGLRAETSLDDLDQKWASGRDIHLFRVLQECLNNVVKHAKADTVAVEAIRVANDLEITVRDNGSGFDPSTVAEDRLPGGRGLTGMRQRVSLLEGRLAISSVHGKGTTVRITLPLLANT